LSKRKYSISSISALFPAYNDAGTIASVVVSARATLSRLSCDYEILVVNDGSQDHTGEVLTELEQLFPELRVIHHSVNQGYGAALRTGFDAATKDLVFYTDGDAQFDPREMTRLVDALNDDDTVDYVTGYRLRRADPFFRITLGRPYHWAIRRAFGLKLRDVDCDFRLFRRNILQQLELTESNGGFCIELLKKLQDHGRRFREVPVSHYPRVYGRSQYYTPRRVLRAYLQLFELWVDLVIRKTHLDPSRGEIKTQAGRTQQSAASSQPVITGRSLSLDPSE
jgi:glycosyltransferase involved in cell wall biosynthesis